MALVTSFGFNNSRTSFLRTDFCEELLGSGKERKNKNVSGENDRVCHRSVIGLNKRPKMSEQNRFGEKYFDPNCFRIFEFRGT